jgi:flagella basal body P-ring formation protein FlgA
LGEERIRSLSFVCRLLLALFLAASATSASPAGGGASAQTAGVLAEIADAIKAQVAEMSRWRGADVRIELSRELKGADLPADGEGFRVAQGLKIGRRNILAPIEVLRDGKPVRSFWAPATVHVKAVTVRAARRIAAGETVTVGHVEETVMETTDLGADWAGDAEEVVGKTARHAFAAGDPLPADAFAAPVLVKRGDTVGLRLERGGVVIESTAKALDDGRLDDLIRVKNIASSAVVRAKVTGRDAVAVP